MIYASSYNFLQLGCQDTLSYSRLLDTTTIHHKLLIGQKEDTTSHSNNGLQAKLCPIFWCGSFLYYKNWVYQNATKTITNIDQNLFTVLEDIDQMTNGIATFVPVTSVTNQEVHCISAVTGTISNFFGSASSSRSHVQK